MVIRTNENGAVEFLLITGKDKVQGSMLESEAYELLRTGKVKKQGSSVTVDGKFVFQIEDDDTPLSEAVKEEKPVEKKLTSANEKPLSNKPLTKKNNRPNRDRRK